MTTVDETRWKPLERWSPKLFLLAGLLLLVGTAINWLAFFREWFAFNAWLGLTLEFGRLAALVGTAGLSVHVARRNARLGQLCRAIAILAAVFTGVLTAWAILNYTGVAFAPAGVWGLCTFVLSVSTFVVSGVAIVRTGTPSRLIGSFLLANAVALLIVFFGRFAVALGLLASVVPALQALLYVGIGYRLRIQEAPILHTTTVPDTAQ